MFDGNLIVEYAILKEIFKHSHDAKVIIDEEGKIIKSNPAAENLFGFTNDSARGKDFAFFFPDRASVYREYIKECFNMKLESRDDLGTIIDIPGEAENMRYLEIYISKIDLKDKQIMVNIIRDITERVESKLKIEKFNSNLVRLLNDIPCGVFTVDLDQKIIQWNSAAENITGYSGGEVIGKHCSYLSISSCSEICGAFTESVEKPILEKECEIQHKDGRKIEIKKNVDIIRDEKNRIIGGIEIFLDITEIKKKNRDLQDALDRIRTLQGLLPICAYCKKIRDEKGYWNKLEKYMSDRSDVEFSHGICDECRARLEKEMDEKDE